MTTCPIPKDRPDYVDVGVGEMATARAPQILTTSALGSCVGVALWDPFAQTGALAHVMLPRESDTASEGPVLRFASAAIPAMVEALREAGSPSRRLLAKIAGGAAMFGGESAISHIGERNIEEVRAQLEVARIPIRAEALGGSHARTVELHLDSGTLVVRSYALGVKEL